MLTLTTMQATSIAINHRDFRFPAYREEIALVERRAMEKLEREMTRSGFLVTTREQGDGFVVKTGRGSVPSFAGEGGFLSLEDARRIFSRLGNYFG